MKNIPLSNGSLIRVGIPVKIFGSDDSLTWDSNGMRTDRLIGLVFGGKLNPHGTTRPQSLGQDGMNLSDLELEGRNVTNFGYVGRNIE